MDEPFLPPGPHGGDGPRLARRLGIDPRSVLDLSQSLNPVVPDVRPLVARHLDALRVYPDDTDATAALAAAIGVDADRVLLTNGASEAIALVAAELGDGWVDEPDFSLYRRHIESLDPEGPRWRSNPHNPTGRLAAATERAAVWDEAFYGLATGEWTRGDADAFVIGSFTKLFACPGLRLGYVVAPSADAVAPIRHRQPRWAVNALAVAVVPDLLACADLREWTEQIACLRGQLVDVLEAAGLSPAPSDANWVLVPRAGGVRDRLAGQAVLVRHCGSFGLADTVRIAVPDAAGLHRLAVALEA